MKQKDNEQQQMQRKANTSRASFKATQKQNDKNKRNVYKNR